MAASWLMKSLASAERTAVAAALAVLRLSTPIVPIRPSDEARYVARSTWSQPADPIADWMRDPTSSAAQLVVLLSTIRATLVPPAVKVAGYSSAIVSGVGSAVRELIWP